MDAATYFEPDGMRRALASYSDRARGSNWQVSHKLYLYNHAKAAFEGSGDEDTRRAAFRHVYDNLRRYWKVFRGKGDHWDADRIFDALDGGFRRFSRGEGASLLGFRVQDYGALLEAMQPLWGLKAGRYYPTMPVSKFLHFFNPSLFPIYDTAVIQGKVIGPGGRFHGDYWSFARKAGLDHLDKNNDFYPRYVAWVASLIAPASERISPVFAEWFRGEVGAHPDPTGVTRDVGRYFAAAFEFTVIGATFL